MTDTTAVQRVAQTVRENVGRVIVGKDDVVELLLVALLCEGHVLLEDVPGIGKTMLAKTLARSLGCSFQRIQFTPDLLPSDITGVSVFNQKSGEFGKKKGRLRFSFWLARTSCEKLARLTAQLREYLRKHSWQYHEEPVSLEEQSSWVRAVAFFAGEKSQRMLG